jgi:hypothetical protein
MPAVWIRISVRNIPYQSKIVPNIPLKGNAEENDRFKSIFRISAVRDISKTVFLDRRTSFIRSFPKNRPTDGITFRNKKEREKKTGPIIDCKIRGELFVIIISITLLSGENSKLFQRVVIPAQAGIQDFP